MIRTIFDKINPPYSLHDMNVIAFEIDGNTITMRTQSGMIKTANLSSQVDGYVEFHDVDFDFCYAYIYNGFYGNVGTFSGEKMFLKELINNFENAGFSIMDENYGYNRVCYTGFLSKGGTMGECTIEIYHKGDMVFVDETEYTGMKEVILSHDSEATIYLVPAEVAADLDKYCWDFAANWVWHGPENGKFLKHFGDNQLGAFFGAPDFIDYLNKWAFPDYKSKLVRGLGCYDYEIPEEYQRYPRYNF